MSIGMSSEIKVAEGYKASVLSTGLEPRNETLRTNAQADA